MYLYSPKRTPIEGVIFFLLISFILGDIYGNQNEDALTSGYETPQNREPESKYLSEVEDLEAEGFRIELPASGDGKLFEVSASSISNEEKDVEFVEERFSDITTKGIIPSEDLQYPNVADLKDENIGKENVSLREIFKKLMPPNLSSVEETGSEKETDITQVEDVAVSSGSEILLNITPANTSQAESFNVTESNSSRTNTSSQNKKAACLELEESREIGVVEILNATALQNLLNNNPNITSRSVPAKCHLVYFFSPYCPFSTQGSAYVNALARSLPNIPVFGFDSIAYHSLNARYGIMGTPSLVLFHNGNVAGRYNASEFSTYYLEAFIHHFTDQKITSINVTSNDFKANLPSQVLVSPPYALYIAWAFLLTCGGYLFLNSDFYAKLTEAFVNNWREAEAQHEHDD